MIDSDESIAGNGSTFNKIVQDQRQSQVQIQLNHYPLASKSFAGDGGGDHPPNRHAREQNNDPNDDGQLASTSLKVKTNKLLISGEQLRTIDVDRIEETNDHKDGGSAADGDDDSWVRYLDRVAATQNAEDNGRQRAAGTPPQPQNGAIRRAINKLKFFF